MDASMVREDVRRDLEPELAECSERLRSEVLDILRRYAFDNRYLLHPREQPAIADSIVEHLQNHLCEPETQQDAVARHGRELEEKGLSEVTLLSIGSVLRRFVLSVLSEPREETRTTALELIESYTHRMLSGFLQQRSQQIVRDQEQLRRALYTALDEQRRELHVRNNAIDTAAFAVMFADMDGVVTYVNPAFMGLFGIRNSDHAIGRRISEFIPFDHEDLIIDVFRNPDGLHTETTLENRAGEPFDASLSVSVIQNEESLPVGLMLTFVDITARKRLELQFRQSQKMEALGKLAGGIVHDFNNILNAIRGYAELELLDTPEGTQQHDDFLDIKRATVRGQDLTQQLRMFTRQGKGKRSVMNPNSVASETVSLVERTFPRNVEIVVRLNPDVSPIEADPSQISQMLMNLCVNARDAIVEAGSNNGSGNDESGGSADIHGRITIETHNRTLSAREARQYLQAKPGEYVVIRVSDNGPGIDEESRDKLFDPFYTTKGDGGGTGLGLAVVYGIVSNHGGFIDVASTPGRGSRFAVFLPVATGEAASEPREREEPRVHHGAGSVLVVDDEKWARDVACRILERAGYTVHAVEGCRDALQLLENDGVGINLILLDVMMPGMGGAECLQALRERGHDVPVVIMTGFTAGYPLDSLTSLGAEAILEKPFELTELTRTVGRALRTHG